MVPFLDCLLGISEYGMKMFFHFWIVNAALTFPNDRKLLLAVTRKWRMRMSGHYFILVSTKMAVQVVFSFLFCCFKNIGPFFTNGNIWGRVTLSFG